MKYSLKVWFQTQENAKYKLYFTVMTVQWDSYQKLPLSLEKKLHLCSYINIDLNIINSFSSALDLFLLFIACIFSMSSSLQLLHNSMRWLNFFLITIQANNEKHMWKKTKLSCGLNGTRHLFSTQTSSLNNAVFFWVTGAWYSRVCDFYTYHLAKHYFSEDHLQWQHHSLIKQLSLKVLRRNMILGLNIW